MIEPIASAAENAASQAPRIAVFAGTTEGRELCARLSAAGIPARAFAATDYGASRVSGLPGIEPHAGRLDEAAMTEALEGAQIAVDATHPYAVEATRTIRAAAAAAGVRYVRLAREQTAHSDDDVVVASAEEAAEFLAHTEGNVLLTTGSKELHRFTVVPNFQTRVFPRVLPETEVVRHCHALGFPTSQLICMQGPFSRELNVAMLRSVHAKWMVTKDTGRAGGFEEKQAAAEEAGARVVLIARPPEQEGALALDEVAGMLEAMFEASAPTSHRQP